MQRVQDIHALVVTLGDPSVMSIWLNFKEVICKRVPVYTMVRLL